MTEYLPALAGGVLIGAAAGIYLLFNGRIMGASGIIGAMMTNNQPGDWRERLAFIIAMLISPWIYGLFASIPEIEITNSIPLIIIAGLLVGFGSRLGSGCTSGHGVCGLGRFSKRSLVSVITFMVVAIATVFVQNHLLG